MENQDNELWPCREAYSLSHSFGVTHLGGEKPKGEISTPCRALDCRDFFTFDALKQAPSYEDGCARKQHIGYFELWAG